MQLFYDTNIEAERHTLCAEQSHHAVVVMRMGVGATLNICDGRGRMFECRVVVADRRACEVAVVSVVEGFAPPLHPTIHLAIAPTKNFDRTEWAVEKAVEIGVSAITPLLCEHSERKAIRMDRLQKIILSASEQSLKGHLATLNEMTPFADFVAANANGFIAHCNEGVKVPLPRKLAHYTILIGPEGDFSASEIELAIRANYTAITLGVSRLRTETAAIAAVALASID